MRLTQGEWDAQFNNVHNVLSKLNIEDLRTLAYALEIDTTGEIGSSACWRLIEKMWYRIGEYRRQEEKLKVVQQASTTLKRELNL
jgi:hypothetical protein